jgi:hypothetical protein
MMLRIYFPVLLPNSNPNAIPLFSIKWRMNQFLKTTISSPGTRCVLIHILRTWSTSNTNRMRRIDFVLLLIGNSKSAEEPDPFIGR